MNDELKKIIEFFEMEPEEKSEHLEDVFSNTVEFFDRFKYTLENGSAEEKKQVVEDVLKLQEKLQIQTDEMCKSMDMSEDELKEFAQNPENFTEEEWEAIQDAKIKLESQAHDIGDLVHFKGSADSEKKPKKTGKKSKSKKWVKS